MERSYREVLDIFYSVVDASEVVNDAAENPVVRDE